jgi:positive regulator of sigma E activity
VNATLKEGATGRGGEQKGGVEVSVCEKSSHCGPCESKEC